MARTTIELDEPILRDLKRLQRREGRSLDRLVSELLAKALRRRKSPECQPVHFRWVPQSMRARVEPWNKRGLHAALDGRPRKRG
jgi:hypothetical protein